MWKLIAAVVMMVISIIIRPKPKMPSNTANTAEQESPVVEAGKTMPVIFGRVTIKDPNIIWYGEKNVTEKKV